MLAALPIETPRLRRWKAFGLEALDFTFAEDRKWQTKSFSQTEELLPPAKIGSLVQTEDTNDTSCSSDASMTEIPIPMRKLIADISKCLDLIYSDNAEAISKTIRAFSELGGGGAGDMYRSSPDDPDGPGGMKPRGPPHMRREPNDCTVRVSNLADSVTEADLNKLFNRVGDVTRASLVCSHETRLSRGFAFVSFRSPQDAARAIEKLNGKGLAGCVLLVEPAARRD